MAKGDYRISDLYQGSYNALTPPSYGFKAGDFGTTTDPRTANILQDVSTKLNMGVKNIEVTAIDAATFDSIPKQHLKEVNRLSKLTGIDVSLHGPLVEASGMSQQGFSEAEREAAERKIADALMRSHDLNPDGNINVTFHSAVSVPASQLLPPKDQKGDAKFRRMIVVNREDGRPQQLEPEVDYYPGKENVKPITRQPQERIDTLNDTSWKNEMFKIEVNRENAERIMQDIHPIFMVRFAQHQNEIHNGQKPIGFEPEEIEQVKKVASAFQFIEQAKMQANSLFSRAYEIAKKDNNEEQIKILNAISKEYGEKIGISGKEIKPELYFNPKAYSEALSELTLGLERVPPRVWVPIEEFAIDKSSQTYGNATFEAYKKFRDKTPITVIENPPAGTGLSTGQDIKDLVEASRKQFVKKAILPSEKGGLGMSEKEATRQAEKFIGATWDVGHINMLRGQGYSEKDIVAETEKVAPYVKHIHLSDNFGFEHTELPMGMGNVPLKQIMEKLGQKGFDAKKIIEAGNWWQHFRTPPFQETLEAVGSPIYSMHMTPYWSQAPGLYQGYSSGYGQLLPQINYETFGAGFSRLPAELGGSAQGAQGSRMSGRQME